MLSSAVLSLMSLLSIQDSVTSASAPGAELYQQIISCKEKLKKARPVSRRITGEDAVLCVATPDRTISIVRVEGGISRTRGATVELIRRNGANSEYRVVRPEGGRVLSMLTNVTGRLVPYRKIVTVRDRRGRRVTKRVTAYRAVPKAVIYCPYSAALHEPAIIAEGFRYVLEKVDRAKRRLDEMKVTSRVGTEDDEPVIRLLTERVPEKPLIPLLIEEHIDPTWIAKDGRRPAHDTDWIDPARLRHAVERVLVTIALNGEDAFDFAVSNAKASGFAQFIKPTYERVRDEYREAKLKRDYVEGMKDHLNAVMAQYCLADWTLAELSPEARRRLLDGSHEEDVGAYIAAAYNGGEHRAAPAYEKDPLNWEKPGGGLPEQTRIYVREFREIYKLLFVHGMLNAVPPPAR
jgi:hypothetical protein